MILPRIRRRLSRGRKRRNPGEPANMEKHEDFTVSEWLEYSFRHFDDLLFFVDDGRVFMGDNILSESIRELNEELSKTSQFDNRWGELKAGLAKVRGDKRALQYRLYGIKSGRHALAKVNNYSCLRSTDDLIRGCEIFLGNHADEGISPLHEGFVEAVEKRLAWERRKYENQLYSQAMEVAA